MKSTVTIEEFYQRLVEMDSAGALGMTNTVKDLVGNTDSFGTGDVRNYTPDGPPIIQKRKGVIKPKSKRRQKVSK